MDVSLFKEVFESSRMDFILSHALYCRDVLKLKKGQRVVISNGRVSTCWAVSERACLYGSLALGLLWASLGWIRAMLLMADKASQVPSVPAEFCPVLPRKWLLMQPCGMLPDVYLYLDAGRQWVWGSQSRSQDGCLKQVSLQSHVSLLRKLTWNAQALSRVWGING